MRFRSIAEDYSLYEDVRLKYADDKEAMSDWKNCKIRINAWFLVEKYREKGLYRQIAEYMGSGFNWDSGDVIGNAPTPAAQLLFEITEDLIKHKRATDLVRMWRAVIGKQKAAFWYYHSYIAVKELDSGQARVDADRAKARTLKSIDFYIRQLRRLGEDKEIERMRAERRMLVEEKRRKLPKPDDRPMTEGLFWQVLDRGRASAESVAEQSEGVTEELERFKGPAIREFQKILWEKMEDAYRWEIWALAYAAQGGCSDDAFEGFRAWLILQGQQVFEGSLVDVLKVMKKVPAGLSTKAEPLLSAAPIAYVSRTGKSMSPVFPKRHEIKGKPWNEETFAKEHPDIAKHYGAP